MVRPTPADVDANWLRHANPDSYAHAQCHTFADGNTHAFADADDHANQLSDTFGHSDAHPNPRVSTALPACDLALGGGDLR